MKPIVLLIEDDPMQADTIRKSLQRVFPEVEIVTLDDEESALACFENLKQDPYFVVSDVMIPWFNPSRSDTVISPPADYPESGFRLAGIRLWKAFREKFTAVPWVYFTVLDPKTIDFNVNADLYTGYVQKDGPVSPLIEEIKELLSVNDPLEGTDEEISLELWKDPEMRAKLLEGMATPLEECWKMPDSGP